jgi:small subunit ribosomal protein S2
MDDLDVEQPIDFEEVALEATGSIPPGDVAEMDLPGTRIAPVGIDMTGNIPPVLEDQGELVPADWDAAEDDLKIIEGIGPHIARVLAGRGITTFAQLAATGVEQLEQIMREEKLRIANPESWPRQAELAASGRWDELRQMQGELKGGRIV